MTDKERWLSLPDEEKQQVLDKALRRLDNFNYKEIVRSDETRKEILGDSLELEYPVLLLELADPKMASQLLGWLYSEVETSQGKMNIPFMGYFLKEITFDKSSLMNYSNEEKAILRQAIWILKEKGIGEE